MQSDTYIYTQVHTCIYMYMHYMHSLCIINVYIYTEIHIHIYMFTYMFVHTGVMAQRGPSVPTKFTCRVKLVLSQGMVGAAAVDRVSPRLVAVLEAMG